MFSIGFQRCSRLLLAAAVLLVWPALSSLANGFSLQSPLPAPTLLIVNHLSDLRYTLPVPHLHTDGGLLTSELASTQNRTYRHYLLSADPLLSSISHQEPEDDLLNELRQSSSVLDSIASTRMQRAQEWSGLSNQIATSESCSAHPRPGSSVADCRTSNDTGNMDTSIVSNSPDSGLHSESNNTSEVSYSGNDLLDEPNQNSMINYNTSDNRNFIDDYSPLPDTAFASGYSNPEFQQVDNQNGATFCETLDGAVACQATEASNFDQLQPNQYQSQINSTDYILSDLLSDPDLQMFGFPMGDVTKEPNQSSYSSYKYENGTNDLNSDSAISSMSCSDSYDSGSENSSHFDEHLNAFTNSAQNQQFRSEQEAVQQAPVTEATGACAAVAEPVNNTSYFECLDANNCTLNYDFYLRGYDLNDPLATFNANESEFGATGGTDFLEVQPLQQTHASVPEVAYENIMHNHTYTNQVEQVASASAMVLPLENSSFVQPNYAYTDEGELVFHTQPSGTHPSGSSNLFSRMERALSIDMQSITSETPSEEDRSLSRDERKARELDIPISVQDIINLPIDEFNERLARYELNEPQMNLIRDIRRRGKNKVAAQNCRKRKMDQILGLQTEVDQLYTQKNALLAYSDRLFALRNVAQTKYQKLFDFVQRSASGPTLTALQYNFGYFTQGLQNSSNGNQRPSNLYHNNTILFSDQTSSTNQQNYLPTASGSSSEASTSHLGQNDYKKTLLAMN